MKGQCTEEVDMMSYNWCLWSFHFIVWRKKQKKNGKKVRMKQQGEIYENKGDKQTSGNSKRYIKAEKRQKWR